MNQNTIIVLWAVGILVPVLLAWLASAKTAEFFKTHGKEVALAFDHFVTSPYIRQEVATLVKYSRSRIPTGTDGNHADQFEYVDHELSLIAPFMSPSDREHLITATVHDIDSFLGGLEEGLATPLLPIQTSGPVTVTQVPVQNAALSVPDPLTAPDVHVSAPSSDTSALQGGASQPVQEVATTVGG
jgi:hypothetical protein